MAIRLLLLAVGLAELLAPEKVVDCWMNLATTESDVELRSWVYTVARLEGVVIVLWVLAAGRGGDEESVPTIPFEAVTVPSGSECYASRSPRTARLSSACASPWPTGTSRSATSPPRSGPSR